MPELTSPWWLTGLALLPLVRWLHGFRSGERLVRVPALFLWKQAGVSAAPGDRRGDPDPAWRRRALLVALLVLALAGPTWSRQTPPGIQVWLDDRPSLFSREEDGKSRLDLAAEALSQALDGTKRGQATLHALWRPGEVRNMDVLDPGSLRALLHTWLGGPGSGPRPPHLPQPPPDTRRWLISDGVSPPDSAVFPFHRAIAVGRSTENLALTRLAVRRSLDDPERLLGLVSVLNAGREPVQTSLELELNGAVRERWNLTLVPGEPLVTGFALPRNAAGTLSARLRPDADALASDNLLQLVLEPVLQGLPLTVAGNCGSAVAAAIEAHPGLRSGASEDPRLRLWCSPQPPPSDGPATLWLLQGAGGDPPSESPVWSDPTMIYPPGLRAAWIRPVPAPEGVASRPLLQAGERILIAESGHPRRIDVLFDLNDPALAARPELPLLLDMLLGRLAGEELLLPAAAASRDPALVRVAPEPLPAYKADFETSLSPIRVAPLVLAVALGLLLLDLYLVLRRTDRHE